jgi:hypothetical protein
MLLDRKLRNSTILKKEPTVRIGWSKPDFRQNHTPPPRQTQLTLLLPGQTIAKPLTEGFAETFNEPFFTVPLTEI